MCTTTDLNDFQERELIELINLVKAKIEEGFPKDFDNEEVTIMLNKNSGNVFFTNANFDVALINNNSGKLESFYCCPICGDEGFFEDIEDHSLDDECNEWLKDVTENRKQETIQ